MATEARIDRPARVHDEDATIDRRKVIGILGATVGAAAVVGVVGVRFRPHESAQPAKADADPNLNASSVDAKNVIAINGNIQSSAFFEGHRNPSDLVDEHGVKSQAEQAEMMTIYVNAETDTNEGIAVAAIRNWELATNAPCSPAAVKAAIKDGYVLNEEDGPGKTINDDYAEWGQENFGGMFDKLTKSSYKGRDLPPAINDLRGWAADTANNFGNSIAAPSDQYGATADTATFIDIDSVDEISLDHGAERELSIGVTMKFVNAYKDDILKGNVYLLVDKNGNTYDATIAYIDIDKEDVS